MQIWHLKLVSSSKRFTNILSVRAYSFQSICLVLSPVLYALCSANSTENPWNGLLWRPVMKPSTACFASNSSRPYFCALKWSMGMVRYYRKHQSFLRIEALRKAQLIKEGLSPWWDSIQQGRSIYRLDTIPIVSLIRMLTLPNPLEHNWSSHRW